MRRLGRYEEIDVLATDIAAFIKRRGDEFDNEDQVQGWLTEEGIEWDEQTFFAALGQLEQLGRIKRPRTDQWNSLDRDLPGYWMPPRVYNE
jgi:hypothetical protein